MKIFSPASVGLFLLYNKMDLKNTFQKLKNFYYSEVEGYTTLYVDPPPKEKRLFLGA
jgi:hypothetical protein